MNLKIALLQITPCGTLEKNLEKGIEYCRKAKEMGADIALFPEMWSNGYDICERPPEEWKDEAVPGDSEFVRAFGEAAGELQMAVGITLLEKREEGVCNTLILFDRFGKRQLTYAKVHTCDFGAEKDEVLIRQNGNPTYFTADIAYHRNKFNRGFTRCIDVWGADHHGHVARMKGAMDAVGLDGSKLDVVLIQLVRLVRAGEVVRMSKRSGKAIQLADLLDEVPIDAARFLFNMREANTQMDFDLDLAVQEDSQNPVYYVQYAHARICSLFQKLAGEGLTLRPCTSEELALLSAPEEIELLRHIASYTDEIVAAARGYDPARITRYVITLANLFHSFYNACRIGGEEDSLAHARLQMCSAVLTVIRNVLGMFKITAPERM